MTKHKPTLIISESEGI